MNRIVAATPDAGRAVRVTFEDGHVALADFAGLIRPNNALAPLADRAFFERVSVLEDGNALGWPGEIDFHADSVRAGLEPLEGEETQEGARLERV